MRNRRTFRATLCAALLLAAAAHADERLVAPVPEGWVPAGQDIRQSYEMRSFVPEGQSAKVWTERIKTEIFKRKAEINPRKPAENLQWRWRNICNHFGSDPLRLSWEKLYLATTAFMDCRDLKAHMRKPETGLKSIEVTLFKAIQGRDHLYIVQRQWHAETDGPGNPLLFPKVKDAWLAWAASVEVCDSRVPDQPCGE